MKHLSLLAAIALLSAPLVAQSYHWQPARAARGASYSRAVLDTTRNVVVRFDGSPVPRTYEWDGGDWVDRDSGPAPTLPSPRARFGLAYDAERQRVVLYGGWDPEASRWIDDHWEWDGARWTRRDDVALPKRTLHGPPHLDYDPLRRVLVLIGPDSHPWEWDGTRWIRSAHAMPTPPGAVWLWDYDVRTRRHLMVDCYPSYPTPTATVRLWSLGSSGWKRITTQNQPPSRFFPAAALNPANGSILLHGGKDAFMQAMDDTYVWDRKDWNQARVDRDTRPPADWQHGLVPDGRGGLLLFGCAEPDPFTSGRINETSWRWHGSGWRQVAKRIGPGGIDGGTLAWEPPHGRLVLLEDARRSPTLETNWSWKGGYWSRLEGGAALVPFFEPTAAYDMARGQLVVLGQDMTASQGDKTMFTWTHGLRGWKRHASIPSPSLTSGRVAEHAAARQIVHFGGKDWSGKITYPSDTWLWNGQTWRKAKPRNAPPGRRYHSMAYDWKRHRVVLYGGTVSPLPATTETWEWDGANWTKIQTKHNPGRRLDASMAYDWNLGAIVLFGGSWNESKVENDTWAFDGRDWVQLTTPRYPTPCMGARMCFDRSLGKMVLIGGSGGNSRRTTTWLGTPTSIATGVATGMLCGSSRVQPRLYSGAPWIGHPGLALELSDVAPQTPCLFGLSAQTQQTPIGGCTLYLGGAMQLFVATSNAHGYARATPFAIPWNSALRGSTLYAQALTLDPAMPGGLAFSAGWKLSIGD